MKSRKTVTAFAPHEVSRFISAPALAIIFFMAVIIVDGALANPANPYTIAYGIAGIIHTFIYTRLVSKSVFFRQKYGISYSITTGVALGLLVYILPSHLIELFHILIVLGIIAVTAGSGRGSAVISLGLTLLISLPKSMYELTNIQNALEYVAPFIVSMIAMETYVRIKRTTQQHIHRLETINKASRQLMQSLDKDQVLSLLNATILDTLEAESYFIGILSGDNVRLELLYDDGEYFNGIELPLEGHFQAGLSKTKRNCSCRTCVKKCNWKELKSGLSERKKPASPGSVCRSKPPISQAL